MVLKGSGGRSLCVGRTVAPSEGVQSALQQAVRDHFDFVAIPLAAPGGQGVDLGFTPSVRSELTADKDSVWSRVVGTVSESLAEGFEGDHLAALRTELSWSEHLGLKYPILPAMPAAGWHSYAQKVAELLHHMDPDAFLLRVPTDGWQSWSRFRRLCGNFSKLEVALELNPKPKTSDREMQRWLAEPVRCVIIPTSTFLLNKSGYPVLPKKHQTLLQSLFRLEPQVIITSEEEDLSLYLNYIARIFTAMPAPIGVEAFAREHKDVMQVPLQPLADHLESGTYRLFETDPIKYVLYQDAIMRCMQHKGREVTVMVVGAGRGPLVEATLKAAKGAGLGVHVWAVEKNPHAVRALLHRKEKESAAGWCHVEVVHQDMRTWVAPRKADIVSELLGSFSDNELSPECLDGAQRFLAEDGVSIPQSYTSSIAPLCANKAWENVQPRKSAGYDQGYVVFVSRKCRPATAIEDVFTFHHPNPQLESNDRYTEVAFDIEVECEVHGFEGFFDSVLYDDIHMSIHPKNHSDGMFSWFPMFIPLREPLRLRAGDRLVTHWWRRHDDRKVWYEWAVSEPVATVIQNRAGEHWSMGL